MRRRLSGIGATLALLLAVPAMPQSDLDAVEAEGIERIEENRDAEEAVADVGAATRDIVDEYRTELKLVDGLETYVKMLDLQLNSQEEEIAALRTSITDVAVIERQILPLLVRMLDTLDQFIDGDLPFLEVERRERLAKLRTMLERSDVTVAEKARRVFEAYQIENDYGRTIEAYTAKLETGDGSFDAEFLRIGRVGLMYRALGTDRVGYWDQKARRWEAADRVPWARMVEQGLKVARQEIAPELIFVNLDPAAVEAL